MTWRFTSHASRITSARSPVWVTALLVSIVAPGAAQETGTPVFHAPYRSFVRYEFGAGASFQRSYQTGVEAHYRHAVGQVDVAFRAGRLFRDEAQDSFLLGLQARVPLVLEERFPVRGALVAGVGLDLSGGASVWIPAGLSLGRRLLVEKSAVRFVPFVQPTLFFTSVGPEIAAGLGLGLDLQLSRGFAFSVTGGVGAGAAPEGVAAAVSWLH
jgi:hypothetical protein